MISIRIKTFSNITATLRRVWGKVYAVFSDGSNWVDSEGNKIIFRERS